jgi:hypothetical protein
LRRVSFHYQRLDPGGMLSGDLGYGAHQSFSRLLGELVLVDWVGHRTSLVEGLPDGHGLNGCPVRRSFFNSPAQRPA